MDLGVIEELSKFDGYIRFYDSDHSYYIGNKKVGSVTSLLSKYEPPFEKDKWSRIKADERGITQEEILNEWRYKNKHATFEGNVLHDYIENYLNNKVFSYPDADEEKEIKWEDIQDTYKIMEQQFHNFYNDILGKMIPIRSELVVGDDEWNLGGMVDQVFYNKKHQSIQIWDWKTNTRLKTSNKFENFYPPLSHLSKCEFNKYSLQMSAYKLMIEKHTNIKIGGCYLVWFNEENNNYKILEGDDRTNEILNILKK